MKDERHQFGEMSEEWAKLLETDPVKNGLQFPWVIEQLGDLRDKRVLEIGTGEGTLARAMAEQGASVVAYDLSESQIRKAVEKDALNPSGVKYFVGEFPRFNPAEQFDSAVANMVLNYAPDEAGLEKMFRSAQVALRPGGRFISTMLNPEFQGYDKIIFNRRVVRLSNGKVQVESFDPQGKKLSKNATYRPYNRADYIQAANQAGFDNLEWKLVTPTQQTFAKTGQDFWKEYAADPEYLGLIATK